MNALDAAYEVLKQQGQPLHYREITEKILAAGLWTTTEKTPAGTVNAQLATDISTSDFSPGARSEAARPDTTPVALMNGEQLVSLLIENDFGVRRTSYDLIELLEEDEET